jgi:hypothetical protein
LNSSHELREVEQGAETADHSYGHANHNYGSLTEGNITHGIITRCFRDRLGTPQSTIGYLWRLAW